MTGASSLSALLAEQFDELPFPGAVVYWMWLTHDTFAVIGA
jgi:hypothetical protein